MPLIPQERPKQIALMVGIVSLALLYVVYGYVYTPRVEEVTTLNERLTSLQDRNRQAQIMTTRGGADLEERLQAYERHVGRLEELIPAGQEVPALVNSIATQAQLNGVNVVGITPGAETPGEFYNRRTWELVAVGEYHDIGRFLTAVASLPRIVRPVSMEIEPTVQPVEGFEGAVSARFQVETYVLPDPNAVPDSAAVAQGGG